MSQPKYPFIKVKVHDQEYHTRNLMFIDSRFDPEVGVIVDDYAYPNGVVSVYGKNYRYLQCISKERAAELTEQIMEQAETEN